jgi:hypothetical protein
VSAPGCGPTTWEGDVEGGLKNASG